MKSFSKFIAESKTWSTVRTGDTIMVNGKKGHITHRSQHLNPTNVPITMLDVKFEDGTTTRVGSGQTHNKVKFPDSLTEASNISREVRNWADKYQGCKFKWITGREKGMVFTPHGVSGELGGKDPHVRGSYEDHPEFGDIRDDMHQLIALLDDVENDKVEVTRRGEYITDRAKRDAARLMEDMLDEDKDEDEDEDYEDEDDE